MMSMNDFSLLSLQACEMGAANASVIAVDSVVTDPLFREMCRSNACGMYGRCWMCPPYVGEIEDTMRELRSYEHVLVFQTIGELEDSYDFEGMQEAGAIHNRLAQQLRSVFEGRGYAAVLHLGAGGCRVCEKCAKQTDDPCRFPDKAMSSLEAYGIHVAKLAEAAGMKYTNGINTVTYFGAVFFRV